MKMTSPFLLIKMPVPPIGNNHFLRIVSRDCYEPISRLAAHSFTEAASETCFPASHFVWAASSTEKAAKYGRV
jgi:hypothetical protein